MRHYAEIGGIDAPAAQPAPREASQSFPASSLGSMPATPQLPAAAQPQAYRREETDYSGLFDSDDSTTV
jgi:hypothetical protein